VCSSDLEWAELVERVVYRLNPDGWVLSREVPRRESINTYRYWDGSKKKMPIVKQIGNNKNGWKLVKATYYEGAQSDLFEADRVERLSVEIGTHWRTNENEAARSSLVSVVTRFAEGSEIASESLGQPTETRPLSSTGLVDYRLLVPGLAVIALGVVIVIRRNS